MVALATVEGLRTRLQTPGLDEDVAQAAVDQASGWVRALSGQLFDFVAGDVVELEGGDRVLTLPQRPVVVDGTHPVTVSALSVSGQAAVMVEGEAWYRQGARLIRPRPPGYPVRSTQRFPVWDGWDPCLTAGVWPSRVRVTYSHGYEDAADVPAVLTAIVLDAAAVIASNPQGFRSEQVGGMTVTYATESLQAPTALAESLRTKLAAAGLMPGSGAFSITCY